MYRIVIQPTALKLLKEISDRRIRHKISDRIDKLQESPEMWHWFRTVRYKKVYLKPVRRHIE